MDKNKWIASGVAVIISLAEIVIIYELWLAGTWLLETAAYGPAISAAKTASFILLFVGSLIAEMQELNRATKRLLFATVLLLGLYQTFINFVVNYDGANIPPNVVSLFSPSLSQMQIRIVFALSDAIIRSGVVVLMWLVTGQVWRGMATAISTDTKLAMTKLQDVVSDLQQRNQELSDIHQYGEMFAVMSAIKKAKVYEVIRQFANGNAPELDAAAKKELKSYTRSKAKKLNQS